jgi:hypothetical protein
LGELLCLVRIHGKRRHCRCLVGHTQHERQNNMGRPAGMLKAEVLKTTK